ncbi:ATP-binding cassette domain-containing protein [Kitasatospora sp. NPDC088346]|uniref:ATP-binding cassette domain-containing protein n=1 Tax=Kitasatospora sp. NPDC088346 TaxID=3364073 RepID=UPI00382AAA23
MEMIGVEVTARGASVRGPRGPVFDNVDLRVPAGGLLVVHGPGGSGRTSLLLTLAGRMRPATGAVRVGRYLLPSDGRRVREAVAVARAEPAVGLEGRLRVDELIAERRLLAGAVTAARLAEAFEITGIDPPGRTLAEDLDPATALLFAVSLSLAEHPAAIVADDVGLGCPDRELTSVWTALERVRATGCTLLTSATEPPPPSPSPPPPPPPSQSPGPVLVALPQLSSDRLPEVGA